MALKDTLRRLQREVRGPEISIPQRSGRPLLFRQADLGPAYLASLERERGNPEADHPLARAARNSSDPVWSEGVWAGDVPSEAHDIEDLSEGSTASKGNGTVRD
jgi:hypothetical protein